MFFNFQSGSSKMVIMLISRFWGAFLAIILVPVYVRLIGIESYGLVAFYSTLTGALAILDLGLSASIIRQVAIYKTQTNKEKDLKDLIFTVEVLNWLIAGIIGVCIILLSYPIAAYWVKTKDLNIGTIQQCVMLMGAVFAFQFPASVYDGVMVGIQEQNANAILSLVFTTLKAVGVLVLLYFISPSIELYFVWQICITILNTFTIRWYVQRKIHTNKIKACFSTLQLKIIWRFAAGITGTAIVTFFITQIDKIIVSRNLVQLSYYSLAFLLASGIPAIISPLHSIIYPKLTQLVATKNNEAFIKLYHNSCKWVSIIVFPIGLPLIVFAKEILFFWTKSETLTTETTSILRVVVGGTLLNCMMLIPYYVTLAKGNTRYGLYQNIFFALIMLPLLFWWYGKYGALGASFVWLAVNSIAVLISIPLFNHIYFNRVELWEWFSKDVIIPFSASFVLVLTAKGIQYYLLPNIAMVNFALLILLISFLYFLLIPETRQYLKQVFFIKIYKQF